ncbi:alkaline phosphatase [Romboutsia weinsteinii]|uniref:Alkaline phosphatase n=1 Tax=Romboutsia weinsteinii TaxID=2020949 RepID=A0A371J2J0_9FIRM|nr:alkaline phosphatase [Romboutsia weinsteinii]RDY27022.1 alkaline phosphatase [Romboutsia weinsteinii]
MKRPKKLAVIGLSLLIMASQMVGCSTSNEAKGESESKTEIAQTSSKKPKYIFTFIGDGMSYTQVNAAQVYNGTIKNPDKIELDKLGFTQFPVVGSATTQDATSFAPDSASTATAISSGVKTHSGVIGLNADKKTAPESITEKLKKEGYKIGVVSSVSLDHATPAAFYAHSESRSDYYKIATQMSEGTVDYFGGGGLLKPTGEEENRKDATEILKEKGYTVTNDKDEILNLNNESGKVYAVSPTLQDSQAMNYNIDAKDGDLKLKDFVSKGIDVLDNEDGFFMMVESGKVDWAGHANDAMSNINDVIALDEAVDVAVEFAKEHPEETLILVTGDHETGGMSIGQATTGYDTAFDILSNQKMSYVAFDELINEYKESTKAQDAKIEDLLPIIKEKFGLMKADEPDASKEENANLVLSDYEYNKLVKAFEETMKDAENREEGTENEILYGGYEPLSVTLTHIINNKAGIGWTSYAHTGVPVPVYAMGASANNFSGSYDNTDIFNKLVEVCGLK